MTVISDASDLFELEDSEKCIHHSIKSVTSLSKVTSLTWDQSIKKIQRASPPKEKTTLYKEIPLNSWNKQEWTLYDKFKYNTRNALPTAKQCKIYELIEK